MHIYIVEETNYLDKPRSLVTSRNIKWFVTKHYSNSALPNVSILQSWIQGILNILIKILFQHSPWAKLLLQQVVTRQICLTNAFTPVFPPMTLISSQHQSNHTDEGSLLCTDYWREFLVPLDVQERSMLSPENVKSQLVFSITLEARHQSVSPDQLALVG